MKTKRIISILLTVIMLVSVMAVAPFTVSAANTADSIVSIAKGELGSTNYSKYYGGHENAWCADFVSWCAIQAGVSSISLSSACSTMLNGMTSNGNCQVVSSPQKGDIVFFYYDNKWGHVGIMIDNVNFISGNMWTYGYAQVETLKYTSFNYGNYSQVKFVRPNYSNSSHTHNYNTYVYYWAAHPHYKCYKCSCGDVKENRNQLTFLDSCSSCKYDLGTGFYATITNKSCGNALTKEINDNVDFRENTNATNQIWYFTKISDGSYEIRNIENDEYLDVYRSETSNGTNIQSFTYNGGNNQRWYIAQCNGGYSLISKCGTSMALDMAGGKTTDGTNAQSYSWNGTNAQLFNINKISEDVGLAKDACALDMGKKFYANIIHTENKKAMTENESFNVELQEYTNEDNQIWCFTRNDDGTYKITNIDSGRNLDLSNGLTSNKNNIGTLNDNGNIAQNWFITKCDTGYSLVSKCNISKAVDVDNYIVEGINNIWIYDKNNSAAQDFIIKMCQLGDVDFDNKINIKDVTLIQKYIVQYAKLSDAQKFIADINGDDEITVTDATQIQKYLAQLIEEL